MLLLLFEKQQEAAAFLLLNPSDSQPEFPLQHLVTVFQQKGVWVVWGLFELLCCHNGGAAPKSHVSLKCLFSRGPLPLLRHISFMPILPWNSLTNVEAKVSQVPQFSSSFTLNKGLSTGFPKVLLISSNYFSSHCVSVSKWFTRTSSRA